MRLTLDELKVAEVAARNYPQYGWGNKTDGKGCPMYALNQYAALGRGTSHWNPYYTDGAPGELTILIAAACTFGRERLTGDSSTIASSTGLFFQGLMHANPVYVADVLATIIRCAEMTASFSGRSVSRLDEPDASGDRRQDSRDDSEILALTG